MSYSNQLRRLSGIARWARFLCWAVAAMAILTIPAVYLDYSGTVDIDDGEDALTMSVVLLYFIYLLAFLASVVCVAIWIHRAHANLRNVGHDDLQYSPDWAVGWYFVPFANLVIPRSAMGELWSKSHGFGEAPNKAPLNWWWGFWIAGNVLESIGDTAVIGPSLDPMNGFVLVAIGASCTAASAILLARIIGTVTSAQQDGRSASRVFA